ncbi:MAG: HDOD domain-containing protein, partial [Myxococcota bacterium]
MNPTELRGRIKAVCPVPATAQRVIELTSSENASIEDIAEAISLDAGLAAETLRLANSASAGRRVKVDTLERAIASVGMRSLHEMATGMGMLAAFASDNELSQGFHQRALNAGAIARFLAADAGLGPQRSVAFLAGLLSEVGAMGLLAVDGEGYVALLREADGDVVRRSELEVARYGCPSRELGAELLRSHGLPETIVDAIRGDGDDVLTHLVTYVREAAAIIADVCSEEFDAIEAGGIGDLLEAAALRANL